MDPISCKSRSQRFLALLGPSDPDDIKLLLEYVESNGAVVFFPCTTVKSLTNLWNNMNLLIRTGKSADQK